MKRNSCSRSFSCRAAMELVMRKWNSKSTIGLAFSSSLTFQKRFQIFQQSGGFVKNLLKGTLSSWFGTICISRLQGMELSSKKEPSKTPHLSTLILARRIQACKAGGEKQRQAGAKMEAGRKKAGRAS